MIREVLGFLLCALLGAQNALAGAAHGSLSGSLLVGGSSKRTDTEATDGAEYWSRRQIVVFELTWDDPDLPPNARLVESHAPAGAVDSLRAVVAQRRWPHDRKPMGNMGWYDLAAFALDRAERHAATRAPGLPATARDALARGDFACWMRAFAGADSALGPDDFRLIGREAMPRVPAQNLLATPQMQRKQRFGMLHPSPDGHWVLDPFQGIEPDTAGVLGSDVDTGYEVYEKRTGNRVFHNVTTSDAMEFTTWLGPHTFMIVGTHGCDPPSGSLQLRLFAPTVWIGDPTTGEISMFTGVPLPRFWGDALSGAVSACLHAAYPQIRSFP